MLDLVVRGDRVVTPQGVGAFDVTQPKGHPDNPVSEPELAAKFHSLAHKAIGAHAAARVVEVVRDLKNVGARELGRLLQLR
jgi:2-methylcitrate dehydratase PrpD